MGQTCANGTRPGGISLSDLQDLPIGATRAGSGCTANVDGVLPGSGYEYAKNTGFSYPDNGEFAWGGLGATCRMCDGEWGCECIGSAVVGSKPTVKRVAYLADPTTCCINGVSTTGGKTCDPKYRDRNGEACKSSMMNYCAQGTNIVSDAACVNWANVYPKESKEVRLKSVAADPTNANNVTYCKSLANNGDSSCDQIYINYCSTHPADPLCSCINSKAIVPGIVNPACIDKTCLTNGYITSSMIASQCPDIITCNMQVNLQNSGFSLGSTVTNKQTCGNNNGGSTVNGGVTESEDDSESKQYMIYVFIAIIIMIIIGGITITFMFSDDNEEYISTGY